MAGEAEGGSPMDPVEQKFIAQMEAEIAQKRIDSRRPDMHGPLRSAQAQVGSFDISQRNESTKKQ